MADESIQNDSDEFDEDQQYRTWKKSAAFRRASFHAPEEIWNMFSESEDCCEIIDYFRALVKSLNIDPSLHGIEFYEILKSKLTSWKCQSLWDLLNSRLKHSEYNKGTAAQGLKCLIIGSGPIGLRMAIESLLLGCKTVVVDKRKDFSRNNVLHLWPFLLSDFKALGAKKFYGKFASGCIDHINIKTLQGVLLKIALLLGLEIHVGVSFKALVEPVDEQSGWRGTFEPENHEVSKFCFNIVVGADGKKNVLPGFPQIELRGALAIGITCNFVNNNTIEEARVPEISGISYQYNPRFFDNMESQYGVKLENIVYYKDETHYFVMTALKSSLLHMGVLKQDTSDPKLLVASSNINNEKLISFTRYAVTHATNNLLPEDLEFKRLSNGKPDIALFDFTSIKKASNASRIVERKKQRLLMALVGDSLIEPFWPTGSGAGRGVLSALDVAWMIKQFASKHPPLAILRERENIFKLLSATTPDSLQKNHQLYTIDPKTRYSGFDTKRVSNMMSLKGLYDTDDQENADFTVASPLNEETKRASQPRRRISSGSGGVRKTSSHINLHSHPNSKSHKKKADPVPVGSTKQFWEEHNKKNLEDKAKEHVPKTKSSHSNGDESEFSDIDDVDDDVIEDKLVIKKGFQDNKVLKRQQSKEESNSQQKKFKSKGGGLKNRSLSVDRTKKTPEKTEDTTRKKSVSKKSPRKIENQKVKEDSSKEKSVVNKENPRSLDPRTYFRQWFERLLVKGKNNNTNPSDAEHDDNAPHTLQRCLQSSAFVVMTVPLVLDCNRPPRRRTTDIKMKDLQTAKEFLNVDTVKETQEITLKRAGSVKNTIQKYKMLAQEDKVQDSYYDFLKRTNNKDNTDGIPLTEDFGAKEVIDVEQALLENEVEEKKRSKVAKVIKLFLSKVMCFILGVMMFSGAFFIIVHLAIHS